MAPNLLYQNDDAAGLHILHGTILAAFIWAQGATHHTTNDAIFQELLILVSITFPHRPEEAIFFVLEKACLY